MGKQELNTILAALLYWQREGLFSAGHEIVEIATDGGVEALGPEAIDDLCESLNTDQSGGGNCAALCAEAFTELEGMGFNNPDQDINGADFVEYGGRLFNDIREALEKDGLREPEPPEPDQYSHWPSHVQCEEHGTRRIFLLQHEAERAHSTKDEIWSCPECGKDSPVDDIPF